MITEEASGWLIHKHPVAEHVVLLTLFTREKGVVRVRMHARRSVKKNAMLQLFTLLWCSLDIRAYGAYVRQIEPLAASCALSGRQIMVGLYLNELIYHALPLNQPEPELFSCYERSLRALQVAGEPAQLEILLRRFEWQLLAQSGLLVSFTHDSQDGAAILADKHYAFDPVIGFVLAAEGFLGAHLLAIAHDEWTAHGVLKTAKRIMRLAIDKLLHGAVLHSRQLYRYSNKSQLAN